MKVRCHDCKTECEAGYDTRRQRITLGQPDKQGTMTLSVNENWQGVTASDLPRFKLHDQFCKAKKQPEKVNP